MDVKEAVVLAKQRFVDLFEDEEISQLALEEIDYDEEAEEWLITLGFYRFDNSDPQQVQLNPLAALTSSRNRKRIYKVVHLPEDSSRKVVVKNREYVESLAS